MSKNIEQIHEFQFNQRLNILKGFKEVSGIAPLPIEDLRKSLGDEPLYTVENLERYTKDVLTKGNEDDIQKAKEVLNSLSCREVIDENGYVQNMYFYVEKGHMDSDGSSGGGGRQGLVKKQITDKTGKNTTRWVRANKDDEKQDKNPKVEEGTEDKSTESSSDNPKVQEHAKNTSTEDLKAYLQNNPDGEHAEHAKAELAARGEEGSEGDQGIDYNDSEAVKNAIASHPDREAIIDSAIENGITPSQALKMHESNKTDHSETHAAIDQAQAALDGLKEKTAHPGASEEGYEGENDDIEADKRSMAGLFGDDWEDDPAMVAMFERNVKSRREGKLKENPDNSAGVESDSESGDSNENEGSKELDDQLKELFDILNVEEDFDFDQMDDPNSDYGKKMGEIWNIIDENGITEEQLQDIMMRNGTADLDLSFDDFDKFKQSDEEPGKTTEDTKDSDDDDDLRSDQEKEAERQSWDNEEEGYDNYLDSIYSHMEGDDYDDDLLEKLADEHFDGYGSTDPKEVAQQVMSGGDDNGFATHNGDFDGDDSEDEDDTGSDDEDTKKDRENMAALFGDDWEQDEKLVGIFNSGVESRNRNKDKKNESSVEPSDGGKTDKKDKNLKFDGSSELKNAFESAFKMASNWDNEDAEEGYGEDKFQELVSEISNVIDKFGITEDQFNNISMKYGYADMDLDYSELVNKK